MSESLVDTINYGGTDYKLADSKAREDVAELKSQLPVLDYVNIGPGSIDGSSGQDGPSTTTTRARTNGYIPIDELWYCNTRDTAYGMIVFLYDANKTYIKRLRSNFVSELVDRELLKNYSNAVYVRFAFSKSNAQMGDEDYKAISGMVRVYHSGDSPVINGEIAAQEAENASLTNIESNHFSTTFSEIEIGTIGAGNGQDSASTVRCRTKGYISLEQFVSCNLIGTTYKMMYFMYDAQQTFIRVMPFEYDYVNLTRYSVLVNNPTAAYVRIAFTRADGAAMTDADVVYLRTKVFVTVDSRKVDEDSSRFDLTEACARKTSHCPDTLYFSVKKGLRPSSAEGARITLYEEHTEFDTYRAEHDRPVFTVTY